MRLLYLFTFQQFRPDLSTTTAPIHFNISITSVLKPQVYNCEYNNVHNVDRCKLLNKNAVVCLRLNNTNVQTEIAMFGRLLPHISEMPKINHIFSRKSSMDTAQLSHIRLGLPE